MRILYHLRLRHHGPIYRLATLLLPFAICRTLLNDVCSLLKVEKGMSESEGIHEGYTVVRDESIDHL